MMKIDEKDFGKAFLYSCYVEKVFGHEQFIPEHVVLFQLSGETHFDLEKGKLTTRAGQILVARRNQLAKAFKYPSENLAYQSISIMLHADRLKKYALDHQLSADRKQQADTNILLEGDVFIKSYFESLAPYAEAADRVSPQMETIKIYELITLLLERYPALKDLLFDFSEPHKIDLEEFMLKNYKYNVPLENFAKLSGRSLASFKRDFEKMFRTSPRKWLKEKRLSEAYYLIENKRKRPAEIYLDLGFENLSHFYASFKEKFGITPAAINSIA
ncbi:helix-turn-helix domain-containing protein [Sphingobacterium prati]|uniref:helix-turn-helix domain-containing protein n=1 Tax=Sphingobacterium prati TaxID=2737006 RepID=UPI001C12DC4A|nr:AraC family transcriptional regulator [Sphingobacterium prati]